MLQNEDDVEELDEESVIADHDELACRREVSHQSEVAHRLAYRITKETEMCQNTRVRNYKI